MLFTITWVNGQVVIGNGLNISEGTTLQVKNLDVIINTDKIEGKGTLSLSHDKDQKITVAQPLKTKIKLNIDADLTEINGSGKQPFALQFLPPLSNQIILAKEKEKIKNSLPVRYLNVEGKTFEVDTKQEKTQEFAVELDYSDFATAYVLVDSLQVKATTFNLYYIIPIYSFLLNNERFSDYAELYEFKCLTALLKPPIA